MTHWQHPGWMGYFPSNASPPSVLAEMAVTAMGAQCMSWQTSPAATELEQVVMGWLRQAIGLPETFVGAIEDTASTSTLMALLCARERVTAGRFGRQGPDGSRLRVYASAQAHSSIAKGVKLAGFGLDNLVEVPTDDQLRADPVALDELIARDVAAGHVPACVVACLGTTSSGAMDPLRAIAGVCQRRGIWLHVDAAWAGSAMVCPEFRGVLDGVEHADSLVMNPHKWLLVNFDCSAYFCRDARQLESTFSIQADYLRTASDGAVVNFRDRQVQLGRRFRALKLWFVLRYYGISGLQAMIRSHVRMAGEFAAWVRNEPGWELVTHPSLALVTFRWVGGPEASRDADNRAIIDRVNSDGRVFITGTRLKGGECIRLSVGSRLTRDADVALAWELLKGAAQRSQ